MYHFRDIFVAGTCMVIARQIKLQFINFWLVYASMWDLHVEHIISTVGNTCVIWQAYFFQRHMPIMWNVHIPVLLVTLLIAVNTYKLYVLTWMPHICTVTNLHMWHLRGIFGTYFAVICEVAVAFSRSGQKCGSVYSFSILAIWMIFAVYL